MWPVAFRRCKKRAAKLKVSRETDRDCQRNLARRIQNNDGRRGWRNDVGHGPHMDRRDRGAVVGRCGARQIPVLWPIGESVTGRVAPAAGETEKGM